MSTTALIEPSQPPSTHKPLGAVCGCSRTPSWFLLAEEDRHVLLSQDLVHDVDEVFAAHARAHEPKRLELLPYDERGLSIEADLSQSMVHAIDWFDEHLRRAQTIHGRTVRHRSPGAGAAPGVQALRAEKQVAGETIMGKRIKARQPR